MNRGGSGVGLVAEYLFAAGSCEDVDGSGEGWELVGWVGEGLPEEDALGAGPLLRDGLWGFEDGRGVGEEAAVPEVGAAAFEDVDVASLEVEGQRAGGFVLAVDDDEVLRLNLRGDGFGELGGGEDGGEGLQAEVRGEEEGEGSGGEGEVGGVGL